MFGIGERELIILFVIVLIIFGPTKLPQLARAIGKSMRELKEGLKDTSNEVKNASSEQDWPSKPAAPTDAQPVQHTDEQTPKSV